MGSLVPGLSLSRRGISRRFGNLVRGWVLLLDRDRSGVVSRKEFFSAVGGLGFPGDLTLLWNRIDKDHSGTMTLAPQSLHWWKNSETLEK